MSDTPAPQRLQRGATTGLALAALVILWDARPPWPHVASVTAPLSVTVFERAVLFLAWSLGMLVALAVLYYASRGSRGAMEPTNEIRRGAVRRSPMGNRQPPPRRHNRVRVGSRYVLTIPAPVLHANASAPGPTTGTRGDRDATAETPDTPTISLLGPLAFGGLSKRIGRAATRELIAYLALHPHGASRDELTEAMWPGEDPRRSRPRFWQSVTEARKTLGDAWQHHGERYQLDRTKVRIDIDELERLLAISDPDGESAAIEAAAALWRGEPLAGADYLWADGEIRRLHATFLDLLVRVGHARLASGDPRDALAAAEQAISLDDLHEPSWRLALQAEHALGLRGSVAQRYEQLTDTLDEQLGLQPSHETRMMYRQLLQQT